MGWNYEEERNRGGREEERESGEDWLDSGREWEGKEREDQQGRIGYGKVGANREERRKRE